MCRDVPGFFDFGTFVALRFGDLIHLHSCEVHVDGLVLPGLEARRPLDGMQSKEFQVSSIEKNGASQCLTDSEALSPLRTSAERCGACGPEITDSQWRLVTFVSGCRMIMQKV